ncbi:MAG: serine/threonine-protein kinase [Nitrospira sp.]
MAPQVFAGKYVVQEEIARGGMGVIYKALDRTIDRVVAIKLVHAHLSDDPSFAQRFLREARAMGRLQHKNIVTIYAVEEDRGTQFLVMEFCPGQNLRDLIRKQSALPVRDVVTLAQQLASALAYAHTQGVIHRDIKPANALVNQQGTAKLTDFGIAAALDEAALTSAGQIIGTPEYMSPEQARGGKLDGRSDLYSLGIVMYEMLTGRTPYAESSGTSILAKLAYDREELTLEFPAHLPSLVQGVVRDLLRRNPDERITDAGTLASQLHELLYTLPQGSVTSAPDESERTQISTPPRAQGGSDTRPILGIMDPVITPPPPQDPPSHRFTPPVRPATPFNEDHTIALQTPDRTRPKPIRPEPIRPSPPEVVAPPPARSFGVIIAVGIVLIGLTVIGLISYFPSQPESPSSGTKPLAESPTAPLQPNDRVRDLLPLREEHRAKLEGMLRDASAQLEAGLTKADCPSIKILLTETYDKYEHATREVNVLRQELGEDSAMAIRPSVLDRSCERPKPQPTAKGPKQTIPPLSRAEEATSGSPQPIPPPQSVHPPEKPESTTPSISVVPTFPDKPLQALLDRFQQAYERQDLPELQAISRMNEGRQRNVEEMFRTYKTLKLSRASIKEEDSGASAVLLIETAITTSGEQVDLTPIARKITLHISRQGDSWDKIVW